MTSAQNHDNYLLLRGQKWQYHRRVPGRFSHVDPRRFVRIALHTKSIEIAKLRRDAMVEADDAYWQALTEEAAKSEGDETALSQALVNRYNAATARAMGFGFTYKPAEEIVESETIKQLVERIALLEQRTGPSGVSNRPETEALLGGAVKPSPAKMRVADAFKLYLEKIAFGEQYNKSPKQKYSWEKTKRTSVSYFLDNVGDIYMEDITRESAMKYRNWWMERMLPSDENSNPPKPNTANRHIGNMRKLYQTYFAHIGEEDRQNPFRLMHFKGDSRSSVKPFENEWVREKILVPGLFNELRIELRVMIYVLIETGARMSEIANLMPDDIRLNDSVPYISIKPRQNRELKTPDSERDIPLVGCALLAIQACPDGFERYRDKGELVSANLMKAFRKRDLLPSPDYVIYSLRHAFEKRMLEAGIDYALRCTLMGHKNDRPAYGDGGSMEYRRDELLKIVHPFPDEVFDFNFLE